MRATPHEPSLTAVALTHDPGARKLPAGVIISFRVGVALLTALAGIPGASAAAYSFSTLAGSPTHADTVDGALAVARFSSPWSVVADGAGNLYVSDLGAHTIRRISAAGMVTTVAGGRGFAGHRDGMGESARFYRPFGIGLDAAGNLFVADQMNHAIRRITPAGEVSTLAGRPGAGGNVDGTGEQARFGALAGLVVDPAGNIFVADASYGTIRKITPAGVVTTVNIGSPISTPLATPGAGQVHDLAFAPNGDLLIADQPAVIRRVSLAGLDSLLAGHAHERGTTDGLAAVARFRWVSGLAVDARGTLFVSDTHSHTIRQITPDGIVSTIGGQPGLAGNVDGVGGNARFDSPGGIAVDPAGNLYIADPAAHTIRKGTLVQVPAPPILHTPPATGEELNRSVGAGTRIVFTAGVTGDALGFQWRKDGRPILGATDPTLTIESASSADQGDYVLTASNPSGSLSTPPIRVAVYTPRLTAFTSRRARAGGRFLWGIAASATRLVAVGTRGVILTSTDGRTWTEASSGTNEWLVGVTFGGGKFVAVGDRGTILLSPDGQAWSRAVQSGTTQRLNNVLFADALFVAVGEAGTIVTSSDALTWTPRASGVSTWLRGLAHRTYHPASTETTSSFNAQQTRRNEASGGYYAAGQNGVLLQSPDGVHWTSRSLSARHDVPGKDIEALTGNGITAIGEDGSLWEERFSVRSGTSYGKTPPYSSYSWMDTGYYWRPAVVGLTARFRGLARAAGALFAVGEKGAIVAAAGTDGPWAHLSTGTDANLVAGVFARNALFVVGENETILESEPLFVSRLINVSTRGQVGAGAATMISGFVVTGNAPKEILVRGVGPALARFGVGGALDRAVLTLRDGSGRTLATNAGWNATASAAMIAETAARVGAFPFDVASGDAALLARVPPGNYTAELAGESDSRGVGLVEAYDVDALSNEGPRAINISTRGFVGDGEQSLIAGFVVGGDDARRFLIRAVGPSLAKFNVAGALPRPVFTVVSSRGSSWSSVSAGANAERATEFRLAAEAAGAFALDDGSEDAALLVTLTPGAYTVRVNGAENATGIALVEVYAVP